LSALDNVRWIDLPSVTDSRGILTSVESGIDIPFCIERVFYMHNIVSDRGGHAHEDTDQVVIAISGAFIFHLSDGNTTKTFRLDNPVKGLYVPRMLFIEIIQESPGSVCLVLANTRYDVAKSIRTYQKYLEETNLA